MQPEQAILQALSDGKATAIEAERLLNALTRCRANVPTSTSQTSTEPKDKDVTPSQFELK